MTNMIKINSRGTLTLPKAMRQRLGVKGSGQMIVEEREEGLLLRPGAAFPIEMYTDERIKEFERMNEEALAGIRLKKK